MKRLNSEDENHRSQTGVARGSTVTALAGMVLAVALWAWAADYSIDWYSIDGGGGTSTGGVYSLSGTIGQPDAGRMSGGPYTLEGGFWGIVAAIQTPGAPWLTITRTNNGAVRVSWRPPADGFVLQQTPTISTGANPWTQVPFPYITNATEIYVVIPATTGNKFLRLRAP